MNLQTIKYCGVTLVCEYEYEPAEERTWHHPGSPANADLCSCKVAGADIMEMLTREQQDEIETLILEARGQQDEINAGEYADLRRNERLMESQYP